MLCYVVIIWYSEECLVTAPDDGKTVDFKVVKSVIFRENSHNVTYFIIVNFHVGQRKSVSNCPWIFTEDYILHSILRLLMAMGNLQNAKLRNGNLWNNLQNVRWLVGRN